MKPVDKRIGFLVIVRDDPAEMEDEKCIDTFVGMLQPKEEYGWSHEVHDIEEAMVFETITDAEKCRDEVLAFYTHEGEGCPGVIVEVHPTCCFELCHKHGAREVYVLIKRSKFTVTLVNPKNTKDRPVIRCNNYGHWHDPIGEHYVEKWFYHLKPRMEA